MANDIGSVLSLDDKGLSTATNTSAKLMRMIWLDLNITRAKWDARLRDYLLDKRSGTPNSPERRSYKRSNFNRAISNDKITWAAFREGLAVLNPKATLFHFEFEWDPKIILPRPAILNYTYERRNRECELVRIYRDIFYELGGTPKIWENFVDRYLNKLMATRDYNPIDRATERGNLQKSIIRSNNFTWENFTTALCVIGIIRATITVELVWSKQKSTRHSYTFTTG